jgi:hypothetical protein
VRAARPAATPRDSMELREAIAKANQILDEERASPTVSYELSERELSHPLASAFGILWLQQIRSQRPRPVEEPPRLWSFKSTNYSLLCALLSRVAKGSRSAFLSAVLLRMTSAPACAHAKHTAQLSWQGLVSELPVVAEFCVRNGATRHFFRALGEADALPGHAILVRHLEDIIALNFTVFSEAEYEQLDLCVRNFRESAERGLGGQPKNAVTVKWPGIGSVSLGSLVREIIDATDDIREECRKARYLYLKGSLLEGLNLEINQDKEVVQSYLRTLGFSQTLAGSLDEAERLYQEGGNAFSLKASMGHLRSFMENLHNEALPVIQAKLGGTVPGGWGAGLTYLRQNRIISEAEEKYVAGLYTLISDQAVHPLAAEREYARLARNVVIEYGLLFLRKLEKLGLKRS